MLKIKIISLIIAVNILFLEHACALRVPMNGHEKVGEALKASSDMKLKRVLAPQLGRKIYIADTVLSPNNVFTETFIEFIQGNPSMFNGKRVLDLGTGSGILAIALGRAGAEVVAGDVSEDAVAVAKKNIMKEATDVKNRISVILSDVYKGIPEDMKGSFDYVIFNHGIYAGDASDLDPESFEAHAGTGFDVISRAIGGLSWILKKEGSGFFWALRGNSETLKILSESGLWTELNMINSLPRDCIAIPLQNTEHNWVPKDSSVKVSIFEIYFPDAPFSLTPVNKHTRGIHTCP